MTNVIRVTRRGEVFLGDMPRGWVDKYDPRKRDGRGTTWRGIKAGGRTSPSRFARRESAAEWVAAWD